MTHTSQITSNPTSRRTILIHSVAYVAGAAAVLQSARYANAAKMSQSAAAYQDSPKGSQQCSNCALFQAPTSCRVVDGDISPSAWCKLWAKKTGQ